MSCNSVAGSASSASPRPNKHGLADDNSSTCSSHNAKRPRTNNTGINDDGLDSDGCGGSNSDDEWSAHEPSDDDTAILAQLEADFRVEPHLESDNDDDNSEEAVVAQLEAEIEAHIATLIQPVYNDDNDTNCSGNTGKHQVHENRAVVLGSEERAESTSAVEFGHNIPAPTPSEKDAQMQLKVDGAGQVCTTTETSQGLLPESESRNDDVGLHRPKQDSGEQPYADLPCREAEELVAAEGPSQEKTSQEDTSVEPIEWANRTTLEDQSKQLIIGVAEEPAAELTDKLVPHETPEIMHEYQDETQLVECDFDDTASESSQLSAGFYEDFISDLSIDLHNVLITFEMPPVPVEEPERFFDTRTTDGFPRADTRDLRHTLRKWLVMDKASRPTGYFCHKFDHVYHQDRFPVGSLILRDMALLNTIGPLGDKIPLDVFFAVLDKQDQMADESGSQGFFVKKLVDLYGHVLLRDIPIGGGSFIPSALPPIQEAPPNFFETALIVVPRDTVADFLMNAAEASYALTSPYCLEAQTVPSIIAYYADRLAEPENRERVRPVFLDVCDRACQMDPAKGLAALTPTLVETIFASLVRAGDWEIFRQLAPHSHGSIPTPVFELARAEIKAGRVAFRNIEQVILASILSLPSTHLQCAAITSFVEPSDDEEAQLWARQAAVQAAETVHSHPLGEVDGRSLVHMARAVLGFEQMVTILPPLVENYASQTCFMLGIINELGRHMAEHPTPSAMRIFYGFAKQTITAMEISKLGSARHLDHATRPHSPENPVQRSKTELASLVAFVLGLLKHDAGDSLMMLLGLKIVGNVDLIARHDFSLFWLPFLRLLLQALATQKIPLSTPRYQHMFSAILSAYKYKFVGKRPPKKWLPARQNLLCICSICEKLNAFFASGENQIKIPVLHNIERSHVLSFICPKVVSLSCDINETPGHMEVTKRFLGDIDPKATAEWLTRIEEAESEMSQFDMDTLKIVVGDMLSDILPPRTAEAANETRANFHAVEVAPPQQLHNPQPAQQSQPAQSLHNPGPAPPRQPAQHPAAPQLQITHQPLAVQQAQPEYESQHVPPTRPTALAPIPIDHYQYQVHQLRQQDYHPPPPGFGGDGGPPPQSWHAYPQHPSTTQHSSSPQSCSITQHPPVSEYSYDPQVPNPMYHTNPQYAAHHQDHPNAKYSTNPQPFSRPQLLTTYQHQHPPQPHNTPGSTPVIPSHTPQQVPSHPAPAHLNHSQGQQFPKAYSEQHDASAAGRPGTVNHSPFPLLEHSSLPPIHGRESFLREERIRMRLTLPMTPLNIIDGMLVSKWEHSLPLREEWEAKARSAQYAMQSADRVPHANFGEYVALRSQPPARLSLATDNRMPASLESQNNFPISSGSRVTSIQMQTAAALPENHSQPPALSNYPSPRVIERQVSSPQSAERRAVPASERVAAVPKLVALVGPSLGSRLEQSHLVNDSQNGGSNKTDVLPRACPSVPSPNAGFNEYFAELEPRLRKTSPNSSVESIRAVLSRRWKAMSDKHRAVYADATAENEKKTLASGLTGSAATVSHAGHGGTKATGSCHSDSGFWYYLNSLGPAKKAACPSWSYKRILQEHERLWGNFPEAQRRWYREDAGKLERDPRAASVFYEALERVCKDNSGPKGDLACGENSAAGAGGSARSKSATVSGPSTAKATDNLMSDPGFKHYLNQNGPDKKKASPSSSYEAIYNLFARTWVVLSETTRRFHTEQAAALTRRDPVAAARFFVSLEMVCPPAKPASGVEIAETPRAAASAASLVDSPSPTRKTFRTPASILDSDDDEPLPWRNLVMKGPRKRTPSGPDLGTSPKMVKTESNKKEGTNLKGLSPGVLSKTWRGASSVSYAPSSPSSRVLAPVSSNRVSSASRLGTKGGSWTPMQYSASDTPSRMVGVSGSASQSGSRQHVEVIDLTLDD
ncbi:hypothetical protein B0T25DRAFT_7755 [Lasiosphaeria hispida]|uniref:HMG box domain-containing protein n=1 Tax=Lasiosphaeria hispida TaxID=260671 RepID=A0AAJ0MJ77_9PEZI|nr:hypothetical protein B0T25DRAFT_7755 [Lasiosphaeria hispida]